MRELERRSLGEATPVLMVPLSGMTEPAWCDKHGVEYYGPTRPECESEAEDYWEDIGDASIWDL